MGNRVAKLVFFAVLGCVGLALGPSLLASPVAPSLPERPAGSGSLLQTPDGRDPLDMSLSLPGDDAQTGPDEDDDSSSDSDGPLFGLIALVISPLLPEAPHSERASLPTTPWVPGRGTVLRKRILKKSW